MFHRKVFIRLDFSFSLPYFLSLSFPHSLFSLSLFLSLFSLTLFSLIKKLYWCTVISKKPDSNAYQNIAQPKTFSFNIDLLLLHDWYRNVDYNWYLLSTLFENILFTIEYYLFRKSYPFCTVTFCVKMDKTSGTRSKCKDAKIDFTPIGNFLPKSQVWGSGSSLIGSGSYPCASNKETEG